jgi:hypothetical protein
MRTRAEPLPTPPDRAPYFRASIGPTVLWMRTPSLVLLAELGQVLGQDQIRAVLLVTAAVQGAGSLLEALGAARAGAGSALGLVGAVVGVAWADPLLELETARPERWTAETLSAYGAAVFEELHEAGWGLGPLVVAALAVAEQVSQTVAFEQEVQERVRFFLRPKGAASAPSPSPSASSSADGSGPGVEAS